MKNFNLQNLVRENIKNLKPYSSARDEFSGTFGVFLDANENPFGTYNRYPDPHQKLLKEQLSVIKNIPVNQIFLGNGSDEVIDLIIRIFAEPNRDEVLIFDPTYGMYEVAANINSVTLNRLNINSDFHININENLKNTLSNERLKIIFICSPNNPTGNLIQEESVRYILEHFKGIVVIDEAYIDFSKQPSWIAQLSQYPNLVVMQTFSKYWGLAGLRVGMCFASTEIVQYLDNVKPPYNISSVNQDRALEALKNMDSFAENLNIIHSEKRRLIDELSSINWVENIFPSDANFVLMKVSDANFVYDELIKHNIIIRNRNSAIKNTIRITVGSPDENDKLIKALKNINV